MPNPILRISYSFIAPTGQSANVLEETEIPLDLDQNTLGNKIGFMVGFAEGLLTFLPDHQIPIDVSNYDELDDYEKMRAREMLVLLMGTDGTKVSDVSAMRIKVKGEIHREFPRVLVYKLTEL